MKCEVSIIIPKLNDKFEELRDLLLNYKSCDIDLNLSIFHKYVDDIPLYIVSGECKNSVECDLLNMWGDKGLSLISLTKKYNIPVEYYSKIADGNEQEHGIIRNGEIVRKQYSNYYVYYPNKYNSFNQFLTEVFINKNHMDSILHKSHLTISDLERLFNDNYIKREKMSIGLKHVTISEEFKDLLLLEDKP